MKNYVHALYDQLSRIRHRKLVDIKPETKIISFSFDDVPSSGFENGISYLSQKGLTSTAYICLSKMDPSGDWFSKDQLLEAIQNNHELASHTYGHFEFYKTSAKDAEKDLIKNQTVLDLHFPGSKFLNFAYPGGQQTPSGKALINKMFRSGRGIQQGINKGKTDFNNLKTIRLYEKTVSREEIRQSIEGLKLEGGWLIFYTHDVQEDFSPWGCSPKYFRDAVDMAIESGISVKTINAALDEIGA